MSDILEVFQWIIVPRSEKSRHYGPISQGVSSSSLQIYFSYIVSSTLVFPTPTYRTKVPVRW